MDALISEGSVLTSNKVDPRVLGVQAGDARYVVEHPKIPFISYPYEWSFPALKSAALLHLDIHLKALEYSITLSDASAYNIQFIGAKPVFIDRLSLVRYHEGDIWAGHGQFCEQFLNPLLLRACFGITHNAWYRGAQEGIPTDALRRLLPWHQKLSWNVLIHIVLPSFFQSGTRQAAASQESKILGKASLPSVALGRMLRRLKAWIEKLEPSNTGKTVWQDYAKDNSYATDEVAVKQRFIADFTAKVAPKMVWDLGCNTGDYLVEALKAGTDYAVGFDFDQGALELGFERAVAEKLPLQLLFLDAANPSSSQGWGETERQGLGRRATADAIFALAFVHHLAIAKNIPLDRLVKWLISLAPKGIIEFIPKQDAMVQQLLSFRKDIFPGYTAANFLKIVGSQARIIRNEQASASGRLLIWFDRSE